MWIQTANVLPPKPFAPFSHRRRVRLLPSLAREQNLGLIEDCAQAHGARFKGKPVGSRGHAGTFSFCQDKIMTTGGEGGMLVLDDKVAEARLGS